MMRIYKSQLSHIESLNNGFVTQKPQVEANKDYVSRVDHKINFN